MNTHGTPQYIISVLESECEKLEMPLEFIKDLWIYKGTFCDPLLENGNLIGVKILIEGEDKQSKMKGYVFYATRLAKQYYKNGYKEVKTNPVFYDLDAKIYEFRRILEEKICNLSRKLNRCIPL